MAMSVRGVLALAILAGAAVSAGAEEPRYSLQVESIDGGMRVFAVVWLPAPPETVRAVLTDYDRWPELFPGRFRVTAIRREPDRVLTDLQINRSPLPGTLRLLCETRSLPDGSLVTSLVEGDFLQYRRRWVLAEERAGGAVLTRAEVDLRFVLDSWVPTWLMSGGLRSQMEEHFHALHARVLKQRP
jgi:ribosome-associated toxin RatA of RatAB toxin-antitoxin module